MTDQATTRDEARDAVRDALLTWVKEGVSNPAIPAYTDLDGDGSLDYWVLDTFGRVQILSGDELGIEYTNVENIDAPTTPEEMQGP